MIKKLRFSFLLFFAMFLLVTANAQWVTVGGGSVASSAAYVSMVSDASGNLYVAYNATRGFVKKGSDALSWATFPVDSTNGVAPGSALYGRLVINSTGNLFYCFQDGSNSSGVSVLKYSTTTGWAYIGTNISGGVANYQSMAVVPSTGYPVVTDKESAGVAIRRFDGTTWNAVGTTLTSMAALASSTFVDATDTVYVAAQTSGGAYTVYKNAATASSSTAWTTVGNTSFTGPTSSTIFGLALTGDNNGHLYMAFRPTSGNGSNKLMVIRYTSSTNVWDTIGNQISSGAADNMDIALNSTGKIYVAYHDAGASTNVVQKYDGTAWTTLGTYVNSGGGVYNSLVISPTSGQPVLAYSTANTATSGTINVQKYTTTSLPVTLTSFTGNTTPEGYASLAWTMGDEQDVKTYILEKSTDASSFTTVATISKNNSNGNYTYLDKATQQSTVYYRLNIRELNGNSTYSNVAAINFTTKASLRVYPNPATDYVKITNTTTGIVEIQVTDILGKVVRNIVYNDAATEHSLYVGNLKAGMYFIQAYVNKQKLAAIQMLKK